MRKTKVGSTCKSILALMLVFLCFTPAFALTPEIHSIEPDHGASSSPTEITIHGDNFDATPKIALYGGGSHIVGSADTPGSARDVHVSGNYAYVADWVSGLQVIDISNPENPTITSSAHTPSAAYDVYISGN